MEGKGSCKDSMGYDGLKKPNEHTIPSFNTRSCTETINHLSQHEKELDVLFLPTLPTKPASLSDSTTRLV